MYNIKIDYKQKNKKDAVIVTRNYVTVTILNTADTESCMLLYSWLMPVPIIYFLLLEILHFRDTF